MYNKLFTKILDSSIWLETDSTRLVWLTLIAVMDEQGFVQFASVANLAHRARVSLEAGIEAVRILEGPDENSSDPEHEGRRIERVPGGWIILNAPKYREIVTRAVMQEKTRLRVQKFRTKGKVTPVTKCNGHVTPVKRSETPSEADTATEAVPDLASDKPPRERNLSLDALALLETPDVLQVTNWPKHAKALKLIRSVSPDVTPNEIARRGANYITHMPKALLTSTALANHWGKCDMRNMNGHEPTGYAQDELSRERERLF